MNFNVTLPEELSEELIAKALEKGVTPTHYLEMLVSSILIKDEKKGFDFFSASQIVRDQAEEVVRTSSTGFRFTLSDLPYFQSIVNTIDLNGRTAPSTIKARIGRNFNKAVADGSVKGVKRASNELGGLSFSNGSAVYEVV